MTEGCVKREGSLEIEAVHVYPSSQVRLCQYVREATGSWQRAEDRENTYSSQVSGPWGRHSGLCRSLKRVLFSFGSFRITTENIIRMGNLNSQDGLYTMLSLLGYLYNVVIFVLISK